MAEILTNNAMFSSFMIVLIVFALGDIVGKITKGKLSGMMVVMLLFLVGFLTKLIPADGGHGLQNQQSCLWKQTAAHKTPGQGQHTGRAVSLWGW